MECMQELRERAAELADLHHVMALLQWDQEVMLPRRAAPERAEQIATMSGIVHRKEVDPRLGELLAAATEQSEGLEVVERALVRKMQRDFDHSTKLPESFVVEFASLTSRALPVWVEARRRDDFASFAPCLAQIVAMSRRQADFLGYAAEPYDALLDLYEEGLTTARVGACFGAIREPLAAMLAGLAGDAAPGAAMPLAEPFRVEEQIRFADRLLAMIGFDFNRGRQDRSAHPFSTGLGGNDQRVTNRYRADSMEFIFSALHEGGHALYEQGVAPELARTPLASGVSLGIHESQSRLWENIIGRSLPFWHHCFGELVQAFPAQFGSMAMEEFVARINMVHPGPIRVEADEVSYNLHVLIRFELEKALLDGDLAVADLPAAWNQRYRELLGVKVGSDAQGVLQDIHWAHGSFGYFPTYTLGNLAAAQIWRAYCRFDPDHDATLARGDFGKVRGWLTEQIYGHGSVYPPGELLLRVTGEELQARYFLDYLGNKFGA
ncbi:MAG: carboxypeptidase M32 [Desulfobulbaceae bacterium]|nr:carboxypeptidase M32 [Desulfobulbaceae bacterium]